MGVVGLSGDLKEFQGFNFSAVDKDEYAFYNHDERKRISQLQQVVEYYESRPDGYGHNAALLIEAIKYALDWLVDYEMGDIPDTYLNALERHLDWMRSSDTGNARHFARTKAFEWIVEELTELSGENLLKYA
jgi:hypothetical protein